ncbi:MAG: MFS transporter [Actinomycetota bacterium]|nr:MFS transporter [Actinomycetota bacterium]
MSSTRRTAFGSLLVIAMAVATFTPASLGILATFIIDDLSISRAELGIVLGLVNVASAVLSPVAGRITDRIGGKKALIVLFATAGATFLIFGTAVAYGMLFVGAVAGAIAQATANPATNKLIAEDVPAGRRGVITGVKQSGVQAGIFLGGLTVPTLAITLGWRGAYLIVAVIPLVLAAIAAWIIPAAAKTTTEHRTRSRVPLPRAIWWLAGFGFLMGFSGAVTFLVPLFVEEVLGLSPVVGGIAAAVIAFVAVPGRILWSRYAERSGAFRGSLGTMAVLSVAAAGLFYVSGAAAAWLLWPAAVLIAVGSSSWNSVGMVAVMVEAGVASTGRASGVVLFGFLTGLGIAPPIFGAIIDHTGSYDVMWLLSSLAAVGSVAVIAAWHRSARESVTPT